METKKSTSDGLSIGAKFIVDTPLNGEVSRAFLEYSMSVVFERALPEIVDGFKPVQRRILYSMYEEGFTPDKNYVKSAKPVAQTMGNYHPHGDSSLYMALVKLAQPFYLNIPLVEGYGNFGDITGSSAASSRYTECRLSKESMLLLSELKENTVPMRDNYSGDREEPVYLPCSFPNLLINGNFGIAVGFASKFAQHNSTEAINAAKHLLKHPDATVEQLMKYIPGPDFPTGGQIIGKDGIISAYTTGQGLIKIRSSYNITPVGRGKHEIAFYELPYETKTETIINKIKDGIKAGKLTGIVDAKDLTDRKNGLLFVVETKAGVNPNAIVNELFRLTPLEETFGINNTCLVDGEPKIVGLIELLQSFLDHRVIIVTKRTETRKLKRETRLHLVEGLLKALANIDEVIRIVRAAPDATVAQDKLIKKFKIDEIQADYILGIALRRLTKFDQIELSNEKKKLEEEIKELSEILNNRDHLDSIILSELDDVKKILDTPRRSTLVDGDLAEVMAASKVTAASMSLEVADEPCGVFLSATGGIVRTPKLVSSKPVLSSIQSMTRGKFVALSNKGRAFRLDTIHVGTKESNVTNVLPEQLLGGERIIALTPVDLPEGKIGGIAMGTKNGVVKIAAPQWPVRSDDFSVIGLEGDDEIIGARWVDDTDAFDLVFISTDANLLTFPASKVRPQGLSGGGMVGIKLVSDSTVSSFSVIANEDKEKALVITHTGRSVKATPYGLYPQKGRSSQGVRSHKFNKGESELVLSTVSPTGTLFAANGKEVAIGKIDNRRDGSGVVVKADELF